MSAAEAISAGQLAERGVAPLNLERSLRLVDGVAELARASTTAEAELGSWLEAEHQRIRNRRLTATAEEIEAERQAYRQAVREASPGVSAEAVEAHVARLMADADPPTPAKLARLLPALWREARTEMVLLLAVATASNEELEREDENGDPDRFLAERGRLIRHGWTLAQTLRVVTALAERIRDELTDDALGEAVRSLQEAAAAAQSAASASPTPAPAGAAPSPNGHGERSSTALPSSTSAPTPG